MTEASFVIHTMYVDNRGHRRYDTASVAGWENVVREIADGQHDVVTHVYAVEDLSRQAADEVRAICASEGRNPCYPVKSFLDRFEGQSATSP